LDLEGRDQPARPRRHGVRPSRAPAVNQGGSRVLGILAAFIGRDAPAGVTQVSRQLGITKNMAFRALDTLADRGYLVRDADGRRYDIGWRALAFSAGAEEEPDIRAVAHPFLVRLHELTRETVYLSVIVGLHQIVIDGVEAAGVRVGYTPRNLLVPLHAGPASRTLLSFLTDEEIAQYIRAASPLKRFTESTITDPDLLWRETRLVRRRGYATGYGDHYRGATYIGFPVLDASGRPHAAVSVAAPTDRLTPSGLRHLLPEILKIIAELNEVSRLYPAHLTIDFSRY
jgi:DNA-binding IclR family transcriptional regulator